MREPLPPWRGKSDSSQFLKLSALTIGAHPPGQCTHTHKKRGNSHMPKNELVEFIEKNIERLEVKVLYCLNEQTRIEKELLVHEHTLTALEVMRDEAKTNVETK